MSSTIFWHDYETFGADAQRDRPCQFAGIRTDAELNIISDPIAIYCAPAEDYLPNPEACFVTGITPQTALREGVCEAEFAQQIEAIFSIPETCVAGYNSIRFDDEVSRNLFYRNFLDPYRREWANGNSRWDLIDMVRLVYVLHPEALSWPTNDAGGVSFRLELLTAENGIEHSAAHDAMSDVYATIELAKLIKQRLPKLFDWVFTQRTKAAVREQIDLARLKPVFHISSKFSSELGCCSVVVPLFEHPTNKNGIVCFDLRQDPGQWLDVSPEHIRDYLFSTSEDLNQKALVRPGLKTIHLNRCPIVLPAGTLRRVQAERLAGWDLDESTIKERLQVFESCPALIELFGAALSDSGDREESLDPDLMLYTGGFFSPSDRAEMNRVLSSSSAELSSTQFVFQDVRLQEMLLRYKGRNFPETLNEDESQEWERFKSQRLFEGAKGFLTFSDFAKRLEGLASDPSLDVSKRTILEDLQYYAESIYPYM